MSESDFVFSPSGHRPEYYPRLPNDKEDDKEAFQACLEKYLGTVKNLYAVTRDENNPPWIEIFVVFAQGGKDVMCRVAESAVSRAQRGLKPLVPFTQYQLDCILHETRKLTNA